MLWYKFLKYEELNSNENFKRANNTCEWFHKILKDSIEGYHHKIEYLIEKLWKSFILKSYNKYKIEKISFTKELKYGSDIVCDIMKFLKL